ncbi:FecCD family ABC transporter permease [Bulleidia extructa]
MSLEKSYRNLLYRKVLYILLLLIILFINILISVNMGSSEMTIQESLLTLLGKGTDITKHIVFNIRLPRILGGLFIGMNLAMSGMIIQSVLNNPLASPSTLGISNASVLGANIALIVFSGMGIEVGMATTGILSFVFAMICTLIVLWFSSLKRANRSTVLLLGVALNAMFSAMTILIQFFSTDEQIASAVSWTFGDLGRINYSKILIVGMVFILSSMIIYQFRWKYNAMDMGESVAHSLGINIRFMRNLSILLASLNTGIGVAYVGIIGFVGLLAPQLTRIIIGDDKRFMFPATVLLGAVIVLFSDTLARVIVKPSILPVGAITSLIGAPFFLYMLIKER